MATLALGGCEPPNVREEKTLRRQLRREMQYHSYATAVPLARRLIQMAPQDNSGWKQLTQAQIGLHDFEGARQTLADWRSKVRPLSPRVDEYEGDIAREEHNFSHALSAWQKVILAQPKNRRVLEKIALLEQIQRRWVEANAAWSASLQVKDNATARINRAACRRRLRQWDEAFEDFRKAKQLAPDDPEVQRWSKNFENLGKFLDQIREFDAKLMALPDDVGLLSDRALLFLRSGDPELALDDSENAAKLAPWAVRPKLFQGIALIGLSRAAECERLSIRQPLRLEALTPEFLEMMSRLDSAISVEQTNSEHFIARSWQLNEIGQPKLALQDSETATRLDPKSAGAWTEISYALMKLGRADEAFEKIKQATELDPNFAAAWQYRGELEMTHNNHLAAIDSLSRALAIQQTIIALQKREECYRRVGLHARADEDQRALRQLTANTLK